MSVSLVVTLPVLADTSKRSETVKKQPNIVFVFSDDHATHAIGAYNGFLKQVNPTPNIDQLARQGMLFRNSFCTNSICGPSRAVIQTGKHSHINGFMDNGNRFNGDQQTFPKLLQKAGYQTAMIGKWHLGTDPQGYDYWEVLKGQGAYYNPILLSDVGNRIIEGHCTDIVTDLAVEWLQNRDTDKPFMLMCQHKAPHRCWMPAARHLDLYAEGDLPEPDTLFDRYQDNAAVVRAQEMEIDRHMSTVHDLFMEPTEPWMPPKGLPTDRSGTRNLTKMNEQQLAKWHAAFGPRNELLQKAQLKGKDLVRWKYQRYIKNYLRCVRGVDDSVGRLMKYLEQSGLADNTIFIYSSDQGFYLGDHGWFDKRWMYEESLKMPLIVKWPGVTQPASVDTHMVQNLDYAQTFLEMAGASVPPDMQGRSLVPLLKGEKPEWRDSVYYHYYAYPSVHMVAKHNGVRTDRYKLMHFYQFDQWELYDLQTDPDELTNQYANPEYANVVAKMKTRLEDLQSIYGDETVTGEMTQEWQDKHLGKAKN
ncbi:MAG: sulfatase [Mariniblastus sp.]|nr:sulfatase [Mariniblastus sp.]